MTRRQRTLTAAMVALVLIAPLGAAIAADAPAGGTPLADSPTAERPTAERPAAGPPAQQLPIEVEAMDGIEWRRNDNVAIARGSVRAVRGETTILADELAARYRTTTAGDTEVWRLEGRGNVRINRGAEKAFGDAGVYDLDTEHLVLTGAGRPRIVSTASDISGRDRVEYYVGEQRIVATGDAIAVDKEKTVRGNVITAYLGEGAGDGSRLDRLDAVGNVSVVQGEDTYRGDRLAYNAETDIATLTGSVTILQGQNKLDGCRGVANLKTGVSTLYGCDVAGETRKPARGLIIPGRDGS